MEEEHSTPVNPVMAVTSEKPYTKLRQVTVRADEEIEGVNQLLAQGWRVLSIGYRPDATVFVLGQFEEKSKRRPGFSFLRTEGE